MGRLKKAPPRFDEAEYMWQPIKGSQEGKREGLVRDDKGQWQGGFSIQILCSTIQEEESRALLLGLKMARDMGIRKLIVEIDSLKVFGWVTSLDGEPQTNV